MGLRFHVLQGDPADAVFYTPKGRVKLTVLSPAGKEAMTGVPGGLRVLVFCRSENEADGDRGAKI